MCLQVKKNSRIQTARRDIIVYKMLMIRDTDKKEITPYQHKLFKKKNKTTLGNKVNVDEVESGFHSYAKRKDCERQVEWWDAEYYRHFLVECVIPKGTKYWKGVFYVCKLEEPYVCYASETLNRISNV